MPTYDYKCPGCGSVRAVFVAPSPEIPDRMALGPCPQAYHQGLPPVDCVHERQLSAPAVVIPSKHRAAP